MKRILKLAAIGALICTLGMPGIALAASPSEEAGTVQALERADSVRKTPLVRQPQKANNRGMHTCVDTDGDGICDYSKRCPLWGAGGGAGLGYVDADGDGVCDNLGTRGGRGSGNGRGALSLT